MDTTASLIAIVELSFKVLKYMDDVRDGGKDRSELHQEVLTVYDMFWKIKSDFESSSSDNETPWSEAISTLFKPNGTIEQLKHALEQIASKIMIPPHSSTEVMKKLRWPFEKSEVQKMLGRLRSYRDTITAALVRANLQLGISTREDVQFVRHTLEDVELKKALDWISTLDFLTLQKASQRQPLTGTGEWFLHHPQIRGWCEGRTKAIWCHGIPGAGKTVLATALFQDLRKTYVQQNVAVMIAYCSFDDADTHTSENIFSSLLRQAVETRGHMSDAVRKLYQELTRGSQRYRPSREDLIETLSTELENFNQSFIIVDGLDELRDNRQKAALLGSIESIRPIPQLLVTSRPVEVIDTWFKNSAKADSGYKIDASDDENPQSDFFCDDCEERSKTSSSSQSSLSDDTESVVLSECENCNRDLCVTCYDREGVCCGCNGHKQDFKWAWPGTISIAAQPEDLERYIHWRIERNENLQMLLQNALAKVPGISESLFTRVLEESHTMFLLAKFHMNSLEEQATARDLINTLEALPSNINEIYDGLFMRIGNKRLASTLEKFLTVVATASKLLSIQALAHAVTVKPRDDDIDDLDLPDVRHLASMCAGLVEIDPSGFVRLAHETIGHYIAETGLKSSTSGHALLAEICLNYLQFTEFSSGASDGPGRDVEVKNRQQKYPFLTYAATHWGIHMREVYDQLPICPLTHNVYKLCEDFLAQLGNVSTCAQFMRLDDLETSSGWDAEYDVSGLHLAAYFGLTSAVRSLLASKIDVNITDCMGTTALMYAAQAGNADAVHILLQSDADPGRCCRRGRSALHRACENNAVDVVKYLAASSRDVSVNAFDHAPFEWTALAWAVRRSNFDIVRLLLTRNDIDLELQCPGDESLNALHRAIANDDIKIVQLLLADGRVSVESMAPDGATPLIIAASEGHADMVSMLLKWGANVNARSVYDASAIFYAVEQNSLKCVRILIEHGADCTFKDFQGRGILQMAALQSCSTMLDFILGFVDDLNPNAQGDRGETPLHDAIGRKSESIVGVLLKHGARTDIADGRGKTPLRLARDECDVRLIDMLSAASLKESKAKQPLPNSSEAVMDDANLFVHPSSTNTPGTNNEISIESAIQSLDKAELELYLDNLGPAAAAAINDPSLELLHHSMQWGRLDSMRVLLDRGADVNSLNKRGWPLLHGATYLDQYEAADLLIARGCDLDIRSLWNGSALAFATKIQNVSFAFLFVQHGAAIRPKEGNLVPVLELAVDRNDLAIVRRLVEEGVPFQVKDPRNRTPYQRARRAGFDEIADYLYERSRSGGGVSENEGSLSPAALADSGNHQLEGGPTLDDDRDEVTVSEKAEEAGVLPPEALGLEDTEVSTLSSLDLDEEQNRMDKKSLGGEDPEELISKLRLDSAAEFIKSLNDDDWLKGNLGDQAV
ncbi:hypothetical protein PG999_005406 [Apiospora kogelbergensis]|uniref:NACHT domain-containing protein n=1 Tax=Apiospora kogelbergensis TaxID=1337665 RepID=A0AAW0R210_9PEZI